MNHPRPTLLVLLAAIVVLLALHLLDARADGQPAPVRVPLDLAAVSTDNGNQLLFRTWSDGSIDVRLVNPLHTQADDWPKSDRAGLSFQEGWKVFQVGP